MNERDLNELRKLNDVLTSMLSQEGPLKMDDLLAVRKMISYLLIYFDGRISDVG
jgi:hypothetical protein